MEGYAERKAPGEKLVAVRVKYDEKTGEILQLEITGDFFMHPESSIIAIEDSLKGSSLFSGSGELESIVERAAESRGTAMLGVSARSIISALKLAAAGASA